MGRTHPTGEGAEPREQSQGKEGSQPHLQSHLLKVLSNRGPGSWGLRGKAQAGDKPRGLWNKVIKGPHPLYG